MNVGKDYRQLQDDEVVYADDERIYIDMPSDGWQLANQTSWVGKTVGQWQVYGPVVVRRKVVEPETTVPSHIRRFVIWGDMSGLHLQSGNGLT